VGDAERWYTVEHARNWIARMDQEAVNRQEELRTLVAFLSFEVGAAVRILELGAGHGLLSRAVLEHLPQASLMALDLSPTMIEEGRLRLAQFGSRVGFRQFDLSNPGWPADADGPFDATISSLALHHLERRRKAELA
jgi:cyclopropane fatty-acyl-phospholipid synthase-like methyltransferase